MLWDFIGFPILYLKLGHDVSCQLKTGADRMRCLCDVLPVTEMKRLGQELGHVSRLDRYQVKWASQDRSRVTVT